MEVAPANRKGHAVRLEHSLEFLVLQGLPCLWISAKSQSPEDVLGQVGLRGLSLGVCIPLLGSSALSFRKRRLRGSVVIAEGYSICIICLLTACHLHPMLVLGRLAQGELWALPLRLHEFALSWLRALRQTIFKKKNHSVHLLRSGGHC